MSEVSSACGGSWLGCGDFPVMRAVFYLGAAVEVEARMTQAPILHKLLIQKQCSVLHN